MRPNHVDDQSLAMSDFAGPLDDFGVPPNVSDDVEMMAPQDVKESEGQEPGTHEQEMDDLFGHDEDHGKHASAVPASPATSGRESERVPSPERERRHALEYEEEDVPPEIAVEVKEAHVKFPNLPVPKSSDGNSWVMRLPNFVSVDTKPFHPDTYIGPEQEDEDLQGDNIREKSLTIKLRVENTLRWRWTKDESGQDKRESNARMIRWSDGTLSLRLGKEFFDVTQSIDSSGRISRSTLGGSQSQQSQNTQSSVPGGRSEGLTYLVAQHKRSQILQAEALITGYMALRPTGMQSETHRLLVKAVGQKHNKVAKLKLTEDPKVDPEREKMELMKQSAKKSKTKRAAHDEFGYGKKKRRRARSTDRGDIYTDDDEETGMYAGEEEEDDEHRASVSPRKPKRKAPRDAAEDYQADDFVVPDESDDDGAGTSPRRKKKLGDAEEDDLEKMEAKMEKQVATDKKTRGDDGKRSKKAREEGVTEDEDQGVMDVESEEEEELKMRRVTSKRAIAVEDEDD